MDNTAPLLLLLVVVGVSNVMQLFLIPPRLHPAIYGASTTTITTTTTTSPRHSSYQTTSLKVQINVKNVTTIKNITAIRLCTSSPLMSK